MKILICQFGFETNTFAKGLTEFADLAPTGWTNASEVISEFRGTSSYLGGAISAMDEEQVGIIPIDVITEEGDFGAGPIISNKDAEYILEEISMQIGKHKGEFDGIFFAVHGAGVAENIDDLEGYAFKKIRDVVGYEIPIMSSLDLHGNISEKMLKYSDGLFGIKTCPHVDYKEIGYLTAKTLIQKIRKQCEPKMALRSLPVLISATAGCSLNEPYKEIKQYFESYVKKNNLIDASFFYGFSAADVECSSASILVVADGYVPNKEADELANWVWSKKDKFEIESLTPEGAIDRALSLVKDGYVVINEASDNPGGGCPGDGTHLLNEMIRRNLPGTIMGPIFDIETARLLHTKNVGDTVDIVLGGKTDSICGEPIKAKAIILNLSNGKFVSQSPINRNVAMDHGKSARIKIGNVECIVVSVRFQVFCQQPFMMTGADLKQYQIVGLKSMNHFRAYFSEHADAIVTTDPPGLCPSNLRLYNYKSVKRPILPLDEKVEYKAKTY